MSVYRRKKNGKRVGTWTAEFWLNNKLHRRGRFPDRETARHWRDSERLRLQRGDVGYVKPMINSPILPLVDEFTAHLQGRGCDSMYVYTAGVRLRRLARDCGWITLGDITRLSFDRWRTSRPRRDFKAPKKGKSKQGGVLSQKTLNQYLDTASQFGEWLHKPMMKLGSNPFADATHGKETENDRYRRAATLDEVEALLRVAPAERRRFYTFLLYCPLRMDTIRHLTWSDVHLDAERPWLQLRPEWNKSRKAEKSSLHSFAAAELRASKGDAKPSEPVFESIPTLEQLKADWQTAGVEYSEFDGNRRLAFHSFRKTTVTLLKAAGVSLEEAQTHLHHKHITTTKKHYDDDEVTQELSNAVEKMPALGRMRIVGGQES